MSLPDVALTRNYSTAGTLGMGYNLMIRFSDRVYLATGPEVTIVAIEMKNSLPLPSNGRLGTVLRTQAASAFASSEPDGFRRLLHVPHELSGFIRRLAFIKIHGRL